MMKAAVIQPCPWRFCQGHALPLCQGLEAIQRGSQQPAPEVKPPQKQQQQTQQKQQQKKQVRDGSEMWFWQVLSEKTCKNQIDKNDKDKTSAEFSGSGRGQTVVDWCDSVDLVLACRIHSKTASRHQLPRSQRQDKQMQKKRMQTTKYVKWDDNCYFGKDAKCSVLEVKYSAAVMKFLFIFFSQAMSEVRFGCQFIVPSAVWGWWSSCLNASSASKVSIETGYEWMISSSIGCCEKTEEARIYLQKAQGSSTSWSAWSALNFRIIQTTLHWHYLTLHWTLDITWHYLTDFDG